MSLRSGFQMAADICSGLTACSAAALITGGGGAVIAGSAAVTGYALSGFSPVGSAIGGLAGCVIAFGVTNGVCRRYDAGAVGAVALVASPIGAVASAGYQLMRHIG